MKPGAGRSAGSYKFPDLLQGPHVDVEFGTPESASLLFCVISFFKVNK